MCPSHKVSAFLSWLELTGGICHDFYLRITRLLILFKITLGIDITQLPGMTCINFKVRLMASLVFNWRYKIFLFMAKTDNIISPDFHNFTICSCTLTYDNDFPLLMKLHCLLIVVLSAY